MRVLTSVMDVEAANTAAQKLIDRYRTVDEVVSAPISELALTVGNNAAVLLKLIGCVASRRDTDSFKFGRVYTRTEIVRYFRAHFIGKHVETLCLMTFDDQGRALAMHELSEGTVNASGVLPRKLVECAISDGATSVVIAHNHPGGWARASAQDRAMTATVSEILHIAGIDLKFHVLVAGHCCEIISLADDISTFPKFNTRF